jgi:hypothetical protein
MVPNKLQIDNLGQVTPLGATSISPEPGAFAAKREGSASGRRRSKLSESEGGSSAQGEVGGEGQ